MRKSKRKTLLGVLIIVVLVLCIGLFMKNKTNTLNSNSIKEGITKELDETLIGAYIQNGDDYTPTSDIPTSGYEFNAEKSYCKIGDVVQEDMTLSYDMDTQTLTVSPIAKEGTKCYLYFDEKASGGDYILAGDNAPTNSTTDWTGGTTYYYTGNPNNWVQFGGFWWRIIRINGDGSIRMIYQGTSANATGSGTQIGYSGFNSSRDNNMYVGYMYTSGQVHGIGNSSTIKGVLDNWYVNYLMDESEYIDGNAGFCNDRSLYSGTGLGNDSTTYAAGYRISDSHSPSLQCEHSDIFTTANSESGNEALQYPIGLITADEVVLAGIPLHNSGTNVNNYLYTNQYYWTMTPSNFFNYASMYVVHLDGSLVTNFVDSSGYIDGSYWTVNTNIRPVINLRSDVSITGTGTVDDPFKIS